MYVSAYAFFPPPHPEPVSLPRRQPRYDAFTHLAALPPSRSATAVRHTVFVVTEPRPWSRRTDVCAGREREGRNACGKAEYECALCVSVERGRQGEPTHQPGHRPRAEPMEEGGIQRVQTPTSRSVNGRVVCGPCVCVCVCGVCLWYVCGEEG